VTSTPTRPTPARRLDEAGLAAAVDALGARDRVLARIAARHGVPPLWSRDPGFATLCLIVLEQQVSLAAGRGVLRRLEAAAGGVEPARVAALGEGGLRDAGLTRQKARYLAGLANAMLDGSLRIDDLGELDDEAVRATLMALPGIGRWTADVYLMFALGRPDVWPAADLALAASAQHVLGLATRPTPAELDALAGRWRPWRSAAARLLWHSYLSGDRPPRPARATGPLVRAARASNPRETVSR
jgi:DNA-3-methyladenine glycosylase II